MYNGTFLYTLQGEGEDLVAHSTGRERGPCCTLYREGEGTLFTLYSVQGGGGGPCLLYTGTGGDLVYSVQGGGGDLVVGGTRCYRCRMPKCCKVSFYFLTHIFQPNKFLSISFYSLYTWLLAKTKEIFEMNHT